MFCALIEAVEPRRLFSTAVLTPTTLDEVKLTVVDGGTASGSDLYKESFITGYNSLKVHGKWTLQPIQTTVTLGMRVTETPTSITGSEASVHIVASDKVLEGILVGSVKTKLGWEPTYTPVVHTFKFDTTVSLSDGQTIAFGSTTTQDPALNAQTDSVGLLTLNPVVDGTTQFSLDTRIATDTTALT